MPNTLCHIAVQSPLTRAVYPRAALVWITAGCIVPDLPWIMFRICRRFDLLPLDYAKLYCTVQASFLFCLLLSGCLALLADKGRAVFCILAVNSLAHLIFDAVQIKWGNGVHLIAPLNWELVNFGWLWPDNPLFTLLSVLGLVYFIRVWLNEKATCPFSFSRFSRRLPPFLLLLGLYLLGPLWFMPKVLEADNHYLATLKNYQARIGRSIEIDRNYFNSENNQITLTTGNVLKVTGKLPLHSGPVSMRGYFVDFDTIYCRDFKENGQFRDWASILGLFLACLLWLQALLLCRRG